MPVSLIGPDGQRYVLENEANLAAAEAEGYRAVTPETPQTLGEQAKGLASGAMETLGAGAQGALRGATAGLSDLALYGDKRDSETDEDFARRKFEAEEQQRLRQESPIASGVGELGGMLASPLSKLSGSVAKGIGATTALGRLGAGVTGGVVEGSLWGAGSTLSEAALGSTELTAEKLFAGAGLGVLLGGAGGGVGTAIEGAVKAAGPALSKAAGRIDLGGFANERWLKASGGIQSDIKKIPLAERGVVADVMRKHLGLGELDDALAAVGKERGAVAEKMLREAGLEDVAVKLKPGMARDEAMEVLEQGLQSNGERIGAALKSADAMGARVDFRNFIKRFAEFKAGLNPAEQDIIGGNIDKAIQYLDDVATHPQRAERGFRALNSLKATLQKDTNWTADGAAKFGLKRQLVGIFRDEIDAQLLPQLGVKAEAQVGAAIVKAGLPEIGGTVHIRTPGALSKEAQEFLAAKKAYGVLSEAEKALGRKTATGEDAIQAALEKAGLKSPEMGTLGHAEALLRHGVDRKLGNRWVSASDYLGGLGAAVLGGGGMGALMGLPAAIGHKLVREKGAAVVAKLADRISQSPSLKLAAQSFAQKSAKAAPYLGQYAPVLAQATTKGPAFALATHMVMAQGNADYAEKAAQAGFLPETPEEAGFAAAKASGLVGVAAALQETDVAINKGLEKVFRGNTEARGPRVTNSQDFGTKRMRRAEGRHEKRMEEIAQLAANHQALLERVSANFGALADHAPGVSAASSALAHRAVTYLASQIQKPVKPGPMAMEWKFNQTELFVFSKKLEAVEQPLSVLEHAAGGTLIKEQVDALKAVYPTVWAQIRDVAVERMTTSKPIPYRQRMMLEVLTGVDPDGTFGVAIAKNQAALAAASEKPSERSSVNEGLGVAKQYATPGQRRELEVET